MINLHTTFQLAIVSDLNVYQKIIVAAFSDIRRLQRSIFIQDHLSILAIDQSHSRVANLLSIPIENIKSLTQMFDNAVCFIDDMNQEELDLH